MSKATHSGTCQACGRVQAVNNKTGRLAKHGYTVDYGYFSGTCPGADHLPLERAKSLNIDTVRGIRDWADRQDKLATGEIKKVSRRVNPWDSETVMVTREEFIAAERADWQSDEQDRWDAYNADKFDEKADRIRGQLRRAATHARKDADLLEELRENTFGNDLTPRIIEDAPQQHRESFKGDATGGAMRKAYDRQRELKAEGIRSRVTGDARYSTITFRK